VRFSTYLRNSFSNLRWFGQHKLATFLAKRVLASLLILLVVSALLYFVTNILPGNVAVVVLGRNATPLRVHALDVRLGYDHSVIWRYFSWLGGILHGNFGQSAVAVALHDPQTAISTTLGGPLLNTSILAGIAAILLIPLTLIAGGLTGVLAGRKTDYLISGPLLVMGGLPEFVTGSLLIVVFFSILHWLPPVALLNPGQSPLSVPNELILPVATLLGVTVGSGSRQVRAGIMDVSRSDYVQYAQLNGVKERRIILWYILRNSLASSVQITAQNLQYLAGGIIVVESLFDYPGIGQYIVQAVQVRDTNKVLAAAIILAALYVFLNIVADLAVIFLVPKLRTEMQ
jgi:peptide/nickel transport system permease protein